jgi:hypothetical protein
MFCATVSSHVSVLEFGGTRASGVDVDVGVMVGFDVMVGVCVMVGVGVGVLVGVGVGVRVGHWPLSHSCMGGVK